MKIPAIVVLAGTLLFLGCKSQSVRNAHDIRIVKGGPFPLLGITIEQTNFEIAFFEQADKMILHGLRQTFARSGNISIDPISMWFIFSYPDNVNVPIEPRVSRDSTEMTGWAVAPFGAIADSASTNVVDSVVAVQTHPRPGTSRPPSAKLTMLVQVKSSNSTNIARMELPCSWRKGAVVWDEFQVHNAP